MKIKRQFMQLLVFSAIVGLLFQVAQAATVSPIPMLSQTSQQMLAELKRNNQAIKRNPDILYGIVNRVLMPHIAVNIMARSVVGRYHWMNAQPHQQRLFISEFVKLVVRTYSTALASYDDQQVRFLPIRENIQGRQRIQVNSLIVHRNGPSIPMNYRLIFLSGEWKVYDFSVDGVGLLQSYRSQFAKVLAQGGFSALLNQLVQHNRTT